MSGGKVFDEAFGELPLRKCRKLALMASSILETLILTYFELVLYMILTYFGSSLDLLTT